jgi:hypothetical protein
MTRRQSLIVSFAASASLIATAALAGTGVDNAPHRFATALTGAAEVPGPGDADGSGKAILELSPAQNHLCVKLKVENIQPATMAHVHVGVAGQAGEAVVELDPPTQGTSSTCKDIPEDLTKALLKTPDNYYVNVHTADFPKGALRGQLKK